MGSVVFFFLLKLYNKWVFYIFHAFSSIFTHLFRGVMYVFLAMDMVKYVETNLFFFVSPANMIG